MYYFSCKPISGITVNESNWVLMSMTDIKCLKLHGLSEPSIGNSLPAELINGSGLDQGKEGKDIECCCNTIRSHPECHSLCGTSHDPLPP